VSCPSCGAAPRPGASHCWLCGAPMNAQPAGTIPDEPVGGNGVWLFVALMLMAVMLTVAFEILLVWPGLIIFYAAAMVPVLGVLIRILWVQRLDFWRGRAKKAPKPTSANLGPRGDAPSRGAPSGDASTAEKVVAGVAMGLAGVMAVIGVVMLIAVAAMVIFFLVCLAMIASAH